MTKAAKAETLAADGHHPYPEMPFPDAEHALAVQDKLAMERIPVAMPGPPTTMGLIQQAVANGAGVETLRELFALKREVDADEARKAFNEAKAAFKAEAIRVVRNITYTDGPLKGKKYADLFGVVDAVTPALSKHGLSMSWKLTKDEKDWLEVTCILTHKLGHSESGSMGSGPDSGPARNAIQARKSTVSYLERITATAILGLAAQGEDDDGAATAEWSGLQDCIRALKEAPDTSALREVADSCWKRAKKEKAGPEAEKSLLEARDNRKKELTATEAA